MTAADRLQDSINRMLAAMAEYEQARRERMRLEQRDATDRPS